jgi:hypothetical protein
MIHHIVLFRFAAHTTADQLRAAGDALRAMRGRIPEIRDLHFGPNLAPESAIEFSHVLVVVCDDMAAVKRYGEHPLHVETVATWVAPIRSVRVAVDLEVGG